MCDELNLYNSVEEQNNGNLFKNYLKSLIEKSFDCEFK